MDLYQIGWALLVVLLGGILQGTVAFGFGLLVVPLLLALGLSAPTVLAIASICTAVQAATGVHRLRQVVPWGSVGFSLLIRGLSMLFGVWVLRRLVDYPVISLKFWVGLVLLLLVAAQAVWRPRPVARRHPAWDLAAFLASGFTAGLCGMGGPPLVLWVMGHDWAPDRIRAFLFAAFMGTVPLQLILLYWVFGGDVLRGMALGFAFSPAVFLGSMLGLRIGARFSGPNLRRLAYLVLVLVALSSMLPQLAQWF
jgi:uncharacterized membrane protein YfcA